MRFLTTLIAGVLLIVALFGIGFGVWAVMTAAAAPTPEGKALGLLQALAVGGIPFIAGTVALAGAGVMFTTEQVRIELELARADRETLAAREVAQRRLEKQRDPAFQAQVEAVKAEQAAARKGG
jgi:hypothetical protein